MSGCQAAGHHPPVCLSSLAIADSCSRPPEKSPEISAQPDQRPSAAHHRPPAFPAVDFFWPTDAWNLEDSTLTFRTQTLL